ncbi:hypothetical protein HK104_010361 [Borealophlyctis nickersoniae]|nr:hypothetical protein HK104_010361 [Borealophlyctis nickersoniae]
MSERPSLAYSAPPPPEPTPTPTQRPKLPPDLLLDTVQFAHPLTGRALQRLNKVMASLVKSSDLVWGEAGWRWHRDIYDCWTWAAKNGHAHVALLILGEPCIDTRRCSNALSDWATHGHTQIVRLLLAARGERRQKSDLKSAVRRAALQGHAEVLRVLLDTGVYVKEEYDSEKNDLFRDACKRGDVGMVRVWLDVVDVAGEYYEVYVAACQGHAETIKLVLAAGALANGGAGNIFTPLVQAAQGGHVDVVKVLLDTGVDEAKEEALDDAVFGGHADVVRLLLEAGVDFPWWSGPLMTAARRGHVDVVKVLLDSEVDEATKEVALERAATLGHGDVVRLLLEAGVDFYRGYDTADPYWGPLVCAAQEGHVDLVKVLLDLEVDDIHEAKKEALKVHADVVRLLLEAGADASSAPPDPQGPRSGCLAVMSIIFKFTAIIIGLIGLVVLSTSVLVLCGHRREIVDFVDALDRARY